MSPPIGPISGAAARQAAQSELRRAEYHRDDPSILSRAFSWLGDRLDSVVSGTPAGSATLILVVLLVGIITFAVVRAGRPRRLARAGASADPLAPDERLDHRALAAAHERDGRLAEAVREWLRAAVETIETRGVVDPRPGRTGAALAREAGAALPGVAADLDAAMDAFDAIWFGRRPAGPADVALAHRVADEVRTARIAQPAS